MCIYIYTSFPIGIWGPKLNQIQARPVIQPFYGFYGFLSESSHKTGEVVTEVVTQIRALVHPKKMFQKCSGKKSFAAQNVRSKPSNRDLFSSRKNEKFMQKKTSFSEINFLFHGQSKTSFQGNEMSPNKTQ